MPTTPSSHSIPNTSTRKRAGDGFATRAIRAGQDPCALTGSTVIPVYQAATFTQDAVGVDKGYDYSRTGNPTRIALERQLADLEGARFGAAFASGMAAIMGACATLRTGDHIVATSDCYGGTYRLFVDVLERYGIATTFVDTSDTSAVRSALQPNTKLLWVETPTNPLELGADIVVHSTDDPALFEVIAHHQNAVGAVPGPQDAYLTIRGAKTLALRMRQHEHNAIAVANWLTTRDDIAEVFYPGLASHPQHELARRQQRGFGDVVSFRVRGGEERAWALAGSTRLFNLAVSLGGVESLICSPSEMPHKTVPAERKTQLGIAPDLLRLSIGLEDVEDLVDDLAAALNATALLAESVA